MTDEAQRLIRLLKAGYQPKPQTDEPDSIWLNHPNRANGQITVYSDGLIVSYDSRTLFDRIEPNERERFDQFMRDITPATKRDLFREWREPFVSYSLMIIFVVVLFVLANWFGDLVQEWFR